MKTPWILAALALSACTSTSGTDQRRSVAGKMRFVLGSGTSTSPSNLAVVSAQPASLVAGAEWIVSPRRAKITFTSVIFRGATGETLLESSFTNCTVTYDRSLATGATLLDCPFTVPVGAIHQMAVYFNKTLEMLVSDATVGIYTDPLSATGFTTVAPAAGAGFVPFTITIGDNSPTRATPIIFASPISVDSGSTPTLYITTDMIHTVQLRVNAGGTSLAQNIGNDPVALFGGPTPGSSMFYSGANTVESIPVQGTPSLRIFTDGAGNPLYVIGPTCGVDGPKAAWASPPIGATLGGWLGKFNQTIAWALPTDATYATYSAYFTMVEATTIGQTTTLRCLATASPPAPADGKTYSSGTPVMGTPTTSTTLRLLAK